MIDVVEIRGDGRVRLGITAPPSLPVHRDEVVLAEASQQLDDMLTTAQARELLNRLTQRERLALLKQLLDDEICTGCGCRPLRCQCHGGSGLLLPAMAGAAS